MPGANELPYFISISFDSKGEFVDLERAGMQSAANIEREFQRAMDGIASAAREGTRAAQGAFNLSFNASGQREAAEAAELQAIKLRAAAQAAEELQREGAELGRSTAATVAGFQQAAREAEELAREQRELASTYELVETKAAGFVSQTRQGIVGANQAAERSVRSSRVAYIQAGQQLQDMTVQFQAGTRATTIFAQQVPQLAFALSMLANSTNPVQARIGRIAQFLAGPWGAAIFIGTAVLGGLITQLFRGESAFEAIESASDSYASAQGTLAAALDNSNARLEIQRELLRANAALMAVNLRAEAATLERSSNRTFDRAGDSSYLGLGGILDTAGNIDSVISGRLPPGLARDQSREIVADFREGAIAADEAIRRAERVAQGLGAGSRIGRDEFITSFRDSIQAEVNRDVAERIDRSLDTGVIDPALRRPDRTRRRRERDGSAAARSLNEFGQDAADRIARLNDQFSETPAAIARANQAMRQLDDLLEDIRERRPPNFKALIAQAEELRPIIQDSINAPFREFVAQRERALEIGRVELEQGEEAAELLRIRHQLLDQMGPISDDQAAEAEDILEREREQNRLIEERRALLDEQLKQLGGIRATLVDIVADPFGAGGAIGNLIDDFAQLNAEFFVRQRFGATFEGLEEQLRGRSPLEIANDNAAESMDDTRSHIEALGDAAGTAASALQSGPGGVLGDGLSKQIGKLSEATEQAADAVGNPLIVVQGRRATEILSPREIANIAGGAIGSELLGPLGEEIGSQLGNALQGAGYGTLAGGLLLGGSGSRTGSGIGGGIGGALGQQFLAPLLGQLGFLAGPLGGIAGGLLGGLAGGLFGSTPRASATLGFSSPGVLSVAGLTGSSSAKGQASGLAGSVIEGLQGLVEQLGGELAGAISVSIGTRKGNIKVDPTGQGKTKNKHGVIDFGEDQAGAVEFAIRDAIRDGVITGLRQGSLNLIRGAGSLDAQVAKAVRFQSVFDELAEAVDPAGFAIRQLNEEFEDLRAIFVEAGASAAEFADLEQLRQIRLKETTERITEQMTGTLRALLDELTVGNDARSLRSRQSLALADLNPLLSGIEAGKKVDYDEFSDAARIALEIQRQISGSQQGYFDLLDRVTAATQKALADQENIISIATAAQSPFDGSTDGSSAAAPIVDALGILGDRLIAAMNDNVGFNVGFNSGGGGNRNIDPASIANF